MCNSPVPGFLRVYFFTCGKRKYHGTAPSTNGIVPNISNARGNGNDSGFVPGNEHPQVQSLPEELPPAECACLYQIFDVMRHLFGGDLTELQIQLGGNRTHRLFSVNKIHQLEPCIAVERECG